MPTGAQMTRCGSARQLPELEFLVPVTGHRLRWTGSPRIAVAAHWDSDVLDIQAYQPSGERLEVRDEAGWRMLRDAYEALFVVRPRETAGTHSLALEVTLEWATEEDGTG